MLTSKQERIHVIISEHRFVLLIEFVLLGHKRTTHCLIKLHDNNKMDQTNGHYNVHYGFSNTTS